MSLENDLKISTLKVQYDTAAKQILSSKGVLAFIIANTIESYKGCSLNEIVSLIEGVYRDIPADPGFTNQKSPDKVVSLNTESKDLNEGVNYFDLLLYVKLPDSMVNVIINVEPQRVVKPDYFLLNRAIYYVCRMVSSQKERDFAGSDFDKIKKVYSIWICFDQEFDSLHYYHLQDELLFGKGSWEGQLDTLNIFIAGLDNGTESESTLHHGMKALFSKNLKVDSKISRLADLGVTDATKKEGFSMLMFADMLTEDLEQEIKELEEEKKKAEEEKKQAEEEKRKAEEEKESIAKKFLKEGDSPERIASMFNYPLEKVKAWVDELDSTIKSMNLFL